MTVSFFDGKKSVNINSLPDSAWDWITGNESNSDIDYLYSVISWLYRCVALRANGVQSMPFVVMRGDDIVASWNGTAYKDDLPKGMEWLGDLPGFLGKTEASACLSGGAYWERQKNIMGTRDLFYKWLLFSSISPIYNGVPHARGMETDPSQPYGTLLGFYRAIPQRGVPIRLNTEDVAYFWLPDHGVEIGPATNTPGKVVLQNAGVIGSMDIFLHGYFERGMVKASFIKYKDAISEDEANRVKEWFTRVLSGVVRAFSTRVIRGDFEVVSVGEGIKDLRDNVLVKDERDAIAVGMGIPPSKLLPVGVNRSTKDGDDRGFIEDTIIPEIGWIYKALNQQIFIPQGMRIKAQPEQLRVMQTDENDRSQALKYYVDSGMSLEAAVAVLGIDVPEGVDLESATIKLEREQITRGMGLSEEAALQASNQAAGGDIEQLLEMRFIRFIDKRDEAKRFERWLGKRDNPDVSEFKSDLLTQREKENIMAKKDRIIDTIQPLKPDQATADDQYTKEAVRRWNKLFPKQKELLEADIVNDALDVQSG